MAYLINSKGSSLVAPLVAGSLLMVTILAAGRGIGQNVKTRTTIAAGDSYQAIEKALQVVVTEKMNQFYADASLANPICQHSVTPFLGVFCGETTVSGLTLELADSSTLTKLPATVTAQYSEAIGRCQSSQTFLLHNSFAQLSDYYFCLVITSDTNTFLGEFHYSRGDLSGTSTVTCDHVLERMDRSQAKLDYTLYWELGQVAYQVRRSFASRGYNVDQELNETDKLGLLDAQLKRFYLNYRASEVANEVVTLSSPMTAEALPLAGDWNGDGADGLGYFDGDTFYLRETATTGTPERIIHFAGASGFIPLSGKWANAPYDGIGLYNPETKTFFLNNRAESGVWSTMIQLADAPENGLPFGSRKWNPELGILGIYSPNTGVVCLIKSLTHPVCENSFMLRAGSTYAPVAGDWYGDGKSRVALFDSFLGRWQFWFKYDASLTSQNFGPAPSSMKPFAGRWNAE